MIGNVASILTGNQGAQKKHIFSTVSDSREESSSDKSGTSQDSDEYENKSQPLGNMTRRGGVVKM